MVNATSSSGNAFRLPVQKGIASISQEIGPHRKTLNIQSAKRHAYVTNLAPESCLKNFLHVVEVAGNGSKGEHLRDGRQFLPPLVHTLEACPWLMPLSSTPSSTPSVTLNLSDILADIVSLATSLRTENGAFDALSFLQGSDFSFLGDCHSASTCAFTLAEIRARLAQSSRPISQDPNSVNIPALHPSKSSAMRSCPEASRGTSSLGASRRSAP